MVEKISNIPSDIRYPLRFDSDAALNNDTVLDIAMSIPSGSNGRAFLHTIISDGTTVILDLGYGSEGDTAVLFHITDVKPYTNYTQSSNGFICTVIFGPGIQRPCSHIRVAWELDPLCILPASASFEYTLCINGTDYLMPSTLYITTNAAVNATNGSNNGILLTRNDGAFDNSVLTTGLAVRTEASFITSINGIIPDAEGNIDILPQTVTGEGQLSLIPVHRANDATAFIGLMLRTTNIKGCPVADSAIADIIKKSDAGTGEKPLDILFT